MKKYLAILSIFVCFFVNISAKETYATSNYAKKDPGLIKLKTVKTVDSKAYTQKKIKDEKDYIIYKKQVGENYYNLYKIFDKLLRANNLYYQGWKIVIVDDNEYGVKVNPQINSYTIIIPLSVFEKTNPREDMLAFILAHELGHYVNDELQISYQNEIKIEQQLNTIFRAIMLPKGAKVMTNLGGAFNNNFVQTGTRPLMLANRMITLSTRPDLKRYYIKSREMDYRADYDAISIMARAGYDVSYADYTLEVISKLKSIYSLSEEYSKNLDRIEEVKEDIEISNINDLKCEGQYYMNRQNVLKATLSSDNRTIVFEKPTQNYRLIYPKEKKVDKYIQKAYSSYLNDNFALAKKYFGKAYKITPSNYIIPLYLSYIYEIEYNKNHDINSLKYALASAKKANTLRASDKDTIKQKEEMEKLYNEAIKKEKK